MESSAVPKSFFSSSTGVSLARLDAEFAQPSLMSGESRLRKLAGADVRSLVQDYSGPKLNRDFKSAEELVRYISIDSVELEDGLLHPLNLQYGDRPSRAQYLVRSNDILVATVRPNRGALALVSSAQSGCLASSGFALLRLKAQSSLTAQFIYAFMRTGSARRQLVRRNRGSMYPAVLDSDVKDVYIPFPPDSLALSTADLVNRALSKQTEFAQLLNSQQQLVDDFLEALCPPPPDPLSRQTTGISVTVRKLSDFVGPASALRFDAEFFRGEYDTFDTQLRKSIKTFVLGADYFASTGRALGSPLQPIPYIKQGALTNTGINWSAVMLEEGCPNPARGRVRSGDILLACTAHEIYYIGRRVDFVRAVPDAWRETNVAVPDLMIVRARDSTRVNGAYLAAFLRSSWGLHQVQRCIRGLRGGHVYPRDIERFVLVPIPNDDWLAFFDQTAEAAEARRNEAKDLMIRAVAGIEAWLSSVGVRESDKTPGTEYATA